MAHLLVNETPPPLAKPRSLRLTRRGQELTRLLLYALDCLDLNKGANPLTASEFGEYNREDKKEVFDLDEHVPEVALQTLTSRSGDFSLLPPLTSNLSHGTRLSSESRSVFVATAAEQRSLLHLSAPPETHQPQ